MGAMWCIPTYMTDIHDSDKGKKAVYRKIQDSEDYTEEEKKALEDFKLFLEEQGQSSRRIQRYLQTFNRLSEEISFDITDPEIKEVRKLLATINNDLAKANGDDYSPWTLMEYKKGLKKFYIHHKGRDSELLEEVEFNLHVDKSERPTARPSQLPGTEEVKQMVNASTDLRNEALIFTLWDTGARIGEILNVKWKDVSFQEKGAKIHFRKSKSQPREIPVYECVVSLKNWKESAEYTDPEDYVFHLYSGRGANRNIAGNQMKYASARRVVKKLADLIDEDYSPHDFRRGRATFLASQGWNAPTLCEFFGWSDFSTAETYIQLANKDMEDAMAKLQGIKEENDEDEETDLRPIECGSCGAVNPGTRDYCRECDELISEEKELMRASVRNEEKHRVKNEVIRSLTQDFDIPKEAVEERIKEKTRERMKERGFFDE